MVSRPSSSLPDRNRDRNGDGDGDGGSSNINNSAGRKQKQPRKDKKKKEEKKKKKENASKQRDASSGSAASASSSSADSSEASASAVPADSLSLLSESLGKGGPLYQRTEMLSHTLLTRDEELELGKRIKTATALRERLSLIAEERRLDRELVVTNARRYTVQQYRLLEEVDTVGDYDPTLSNWMLLRGEGDGNGKASEELFLPSDEELFALGMGRSFSSVDANGAGTTVGGQDEDDNDDDEQLLLAQDSGFTILDQTAEASASVSTPLVVQEGGPFAMDSVERDLNEVSNQEVIGTLGVSGGKDELRQIFQSGADARRVLMSSNLRLVVSIAKKWMKGSIGQSSDGVKLRELYAGGWDRPSLDEAIQEGILGLARAVDLYDYGRGMRFSTYATYWITNYVRIVFRTAKTGPLHVPPSLYEIKNKYRRFVADLYKEDKPIPDIEDIAKELGCNVKRLKIALTITESLLSIDQPVQSINGYRGNKGSGAGEMGLSRSELNLADTLVW